MSDFGYATDGPTLSLPQKLWQISWPFVILISCVAGLGFTMLYSAAGGSVEPWAGRQATRFAIGLVLMIVVAVTDLRLWLRYAYVFYAVALVLLAAVELAGSIGMGARRWIALGSLSLQPSEIMKVGVVLALARYFHGLDEGHANRLVNLLVPVGLVAMPILLVLRQPDLGTATMIGLCSAVLFYLAGVALWKFLLLGAIGASLIPVAWRVLHEYQRQRILTFLDPGRDPLGAGYHITQSKIALGSGGIAGKGFLAGTQAHLNFLPEKQTDFIFTMLAEELGMVGGVALLGLYTLVIAYGLLIALQARSQFGRLVGLGVCANFFLYAFINIAMVMGLIPVVGVPLPLISYGGTAMWTILLSFGLLLSVSVHRDINIGRYPDGLG